MSDRMPVAAQTLPVCAFRKNVAMSSGTRTALIFRSTAGAELVRGTGQTGEIRGGMRRHRLDRAVRSGRMAARGVVNGESRSKAAMELQPNVAEFAILR